MIFFLVRIQLWKKSGAWFFRALPTRTSLPSNVKPSASAISSVTTKSDSISIDDDSSSDGRRTSSSLSKTFRQIFNQSINLLLSIAIPTNNYTTVSSYQQNYDDTNLMNGRERDESIDSFKTDERSSKSMNILFFLFALLNMKTILVFSF